jgi:hypothetical protein
MSPVVCHILILKRPVFRVKVVFYRKLRRVYLGSGLNAASHVRFGLKADMRSAKRHICFIPNSGH